MLASDMSGAFAEPMFGNSFNVVWFDDLIKLKLTKKLEFVVFISSFTS